MVDELGSVQIRPTAHVLGMFKQVIESRSHSLEIVREALSNMCTPEVGATDVHVQFYVDPDYGGTFVFRDNGCGMPYTGDATNPERLDRFLNLGYGGAAGLGGDKYGWKGLGSKLMYNCRKLSVATWTGKPSDPVYMVEVHEPRAKLLKDVPEWPNAYLSKRKSEAADVKGTSIRVYGFEGGQQSLDLDELEQYMLWNTIAGVTRPEPLPKIILKVGNAEKEVKTGYPYVKASSADDPEAWKTVIVAPPIEVTERAANGHDVKVVLKGGFTLNTADACGEGISLSRFRGNTGIRLSVLGIPYFRLPYYETKGENFQQYQDLTSFVVECDSLATKLNIDRSGYNADDPAVTAFLKASRKAFDILTQTEAYQRFQKMRRREEEKMKSKFLTERKDVLNAANQEYACMSDANGKWRLLHRVPDNESDTLALFWKLEGLGRLPFARFDSLEHTGKSGIDVIATYQINEDGQLRMMEAVEFEYLFENFIEHGHNPRQTALVICWDIKSPQKLQGISEWLWRATVEDQVISVVRIKGFPGLVAKTRNQLGN